MMMLLLLLLLLDLLDEKRVVVASSLCTSDSMHKNSLFLYTYLNITYQSMIRKSSPVASRDTSDDARTE